MGKEFWIIFTHRNQRYMDVNALYENDNNKRDVNKNGNNLLKTEIRKYLWILGYGVSVDTITQNTYSIIIRTAWL